jgi:GNAT superfamily N-acetyltransferase
MLELMSDDTLAIRRADIMAPEAQSLIDALNAELSARYPEPGPNYFRLDAEEVAPGRGAFLIASRKGRPVGCGAVRRIDARTAEIKRTYVGPDGRGRGVGRAISTALEAEAKLLGVVCLLLETGARQPEAIGLYEGAGFTRTGSFGKYATSPLSVFMRKDL